MRAEAGGPAVWVSESLRAVPKNIYGVTKCAAEDLCQLFHRNQGLPCIVLKTSRFFPEQDDSKQARSQFDDTNLKVNELLFRRIDIADVVQAHLHAMDRCRMLGFDRFIISATTPFKPADSLALATDAAKVVAQYVPEFVATYEQLGWKMFPVIGRVYDNAHARDRLQWEPKYDFRYAIDRLRARLDYRSDLTLKIGRKGYHDKTFTEGPYPLDN
jgi:UDP-glucose 4-epimerase